MTTQSLTTSVTSTTLCPSTTNSFHDTVIDEPLDIKTSHPDVYASHPSLSTSMRLPPSMKSVPGPFARYGLALPHKGPSAPQNVRVVKGRKGSILISWTPVRYNAQ